MEENALSVLALASKRAYLTVRGRQPVAAVLDVLTALDLKTKHHQTPIISHYHKTPIGWRVAIRLPAGIASKEITSRLDYFQEQCGGTVTASIKANHVHLDIVTQAMPEIVPFSHEPTDKLMLPIGDTVHGPLSVELPRLPHLFVAGQTGGGKTCFLRASAVSLILQGCYLMIIDLKGLDFHHLREHAIVVDTEGDAFRLLHLLNREHDRRRDALKKAGVTDATDYPGNMPRIVLIIDELAELSDKEAQGNLNRLLRLSRAMGISIMAATQRPSHTLYNKFTDSRMLFAGRLCFAMPKPEDSKVILGNDAASKMPQDIPGRAIWQWGAQQEVQCMYLPPSRAKTYLDAIPRLEGFAIEQQHHRLPT